eukprot:2222973-Ditylum_brightwellii.AAC.1
MKLNFSAYEKVSVTMFKYVAGMLDQLPEDFNEEVASPTASHIFSRREKRPRHWTNQGHNFFITMLQIYYSSASEHNLTYKPV